MTSEHIEGKDSKMGDRILVSALFMKNTLKNKMRNWKEAQLSDLRTGRS